ncbi:TcpQ domain-containing protein (plasmid) [Citrobacter freundii]|nr:pili assembly chaperone [Citrobacter portucalensis]MBA8564005.1 TcpQ domain-containing protein [Citrobacter freundii]TRL60285.1 pili assembly chaperone [Citrobacter youngae]MDH1298598.1 TcpQ domain-containing protein [Citrobacter freundii]QMF90498.1 TcpQ domain-containing protein [Citrobacter freundii]
MHKIALPLLIPSLLSSCTGFQNRNVAPDTPALVFVDGQISDSADIIKQTQRRIAPPAATPVPVRQSATAAQLSKTSPLPQPKMLASSISKSSAPGSVANPSLSTLTFIGTPGPVAVLSLSPARNLTLEQWVKRIIPTGWALNYENALRPVLNTRIVSVYTNDQWTRVLNRLLEEQSIQAQVDWNRHAVTLQRKGQSTQLTTSASPTENRTTPAQAAGVPKNPFSGSDSAQPVAQATVKSPTPVTTKSAQTPIAVKPQPVTGQPIAPVIQGKTWTAPAGTTLREMLMKWAQDTRCESGASPHWTVIWPVAVTDYRLDAPLTFRGSFETMLGQMFDLYRTAQKPLYAEASRMQCVVSVTDTPAGR